MHVTRFNPGYAPGRRRTAEAQQLAKDIDRDINLGSVDSDFESFGLPSSRNFTIGDSLVVNLDAGAPVAFTRRMW